MNRAFSSQLPPFDRRSPFKALGVRLNPLRDESYYASLVCSPYPISHGCTRMYCVFHSSTSSRLCSLRQSVLHRGHMMQCSSSSSSSFQSRANRPTSGSFMLLLGRKQSSTKSSDASAACSSKLLRARVN